MVRKSLLAAAAVMLAAGLPSHAIAQIGVERFTPKAQQGATRIDYSHWDEALSYFVFRMGRSDRKNPGRVEPELGTRLVYGHESRLRLEGNRVGFSFLEAQQVEALTQYRRDLEKTAETIDIPSLSRNEQLAFWMNLHNVAVIEQIARAYPILQPSRMQIGPEGLPLDEAKVVTINGVALSPRDIRTRIVYPNWKDPRVIYGFFHGEVGGPTIQRRAFNAANLNELLTSSAIDFVNSLRGTEKRGDTLHVSRLYEEAAPFYFGEWESDLRAHLIKYATPEVRELVGNTSQLRATIYEQDVSDLAGGERNPNYGFVVENTDPKKWGFAVTDGRTSRIGVPRNISRLVNEKQEKLRRLARDGKLQGKVIVLDPEQLREMEIE